MSAAAGLLRVTTLNILHDAVRTLAASWSARRAPLAESIRALDPDVLCLQEVSARQLDDLRADLDAYDLVEGAASGPIVLPAWFLPLAKPAHWLLRDFFTAGEWCPILLRRGSFERTADGTLRVPSPRSRAFTPHAIHWVRARSTATGAEFEIDNTHLGILPWREAATAREVLRLLDGERSAPVQILTGDFNSRHTGTLLRALTAPDAGFRDCWAAAERREGAGATFHWGLGLPGPRIDYVLVRPERRVARAHVVSAGHGRARCSDHHPLTIEIDLDARVRPGSPGRTP